MSSAFYSIKGLELLGDKAALDTQNAKELCDFAKAKVDKSSMESIYYATSLGSLIPSCQLDMSSFQDILAKADSSANVADLYYYVMTAETLKIKFDSKKVATSLTSALKNDGSIVNQGFSLHIAAKLSEQNKPFYESIEDILDQADEVDKVMLQYEGGVGTTGIVLEGIITLSEKFGLLPAKLTTERLGKFVNYMISKRFPTNIKSAYFLLKASVKLSDNKFMVPLFLTRQSPISVTATSANLLVSLTNLLGGPVKEDQLNLEAISATSSNKASLFSAKKSFTVKSSDRTTFEVKLVEGNAQLTPGFYAVTVGLNAASKKFFLTKNTVEVKVTTKISVASVQLSVSDIDTTNPKFEKYEGKSKNMEADQQSKLTVKFEIKDQIKNTLIEAHQAFLKFSHVKSGKEIIYLAESSLSKNYMVEVDFAANAKNFRHQSGTYSVELIVSDNLFENPSVLKLSDIKLKFSSQPNEDNKSSLFAAKPEIKHIFRVPDVRPPQGVSMIFTLLCLIPLALVIALWFKIGFNFSKFEFSLSGLVFHLSLASIFGLYYCYWTRINMFETVRYLGIIGFVALVAGNQLLKSLAAKKEKAN